LKKGRGKEKDGKVEREKEDEIFNLMKLTKLPLVVV
jgi:hypothetical protein